MTYFTPAQEYFRGLIGLNKQPMFPNNVLQGLPQMAPQSMAPQPMGPAPMAPAPQNPMPQAAPAMPQQDNPITKGLSAGMQTARDAIDWDEDQKSQLMGLAFAQMFGGLSANQGQHPTVLGGLNLGLRDAVNSMGDERERIWRMNKMQLDRQDMMEKELQRRLERQEDMEFKRKVHQDEMGYKNKELASGMTPYQQQALALRAQELALKKGPEYNPGNLVDMGNGKAIDLSKVDVTQYKPFGNNKKVADQVAKERTAVDEQLTKVNEAINLLNKYRDYKKDKNFLLDPQNPLTRGFATEFYNITGHVLGNKEMKDFANTSMMVKSLFDRVRAMQERALEGNTLKQGLTNYYEKLGLYANLGHMTDEQALNSAGMMRDTLAREKRRLELSHAMGRNISESEADKIEREASVLTEGSKARIAEYRAQHPELDKYSDEKILKVIQMKEGK